MADLAAQVRPIPCSAINDFLSVLGSSIDCNLQGSVGGRDPSNVVPRQKSQSSRWSWDELGG